MIFSRLHSPRRFLSVSLSLPMYTIIIALVFLIHHAKSEELPIDYLTEESVVLITGAAGFLGSELALALHRTYKPKQIICVDRMTENPMTQKELAQFEFQRQRTFSVLQTLGSNGSFYRVDFRPMIPEYFDLGEVPVLDHIFRQHPDITHVVHLADPFPHAALQVIAREKDVPKAGMMEALMEQFLKVQRSGQRVPHFLYASSSEVYPSTSKNANPPFTETHTISTPSSLRGAAKLIDETLAKMYNDMHGIYSVGLRFFSVYGPWSAPGSPLFEMAERAVTGDAILWDEKWTDINDFVYIDDAIDAMMAAMQFRPSGGEKTPPVVFNVASGQGTSLQEIAAIMEKHFPHKKPLETHEMPVQEDPNPTTSFGSTERAEKFLGYIPRVPLEEGVVKLLAWHYDRAFPYGGGRQEIPDERASFVASHGIVSCPPSDKECLKGTPVFPCASECSHEVQCVDSFYDEIIGWTQALTKKCEVVLYTIDLSNSLESLPSAHLKIRSKSDSFVAGDCNVAFVSANSVLYKSISTQSSVSSFLGGSRTVQKNGEWILAPVKIPSSDGEPAHASERMLSLLPKLSPGLFFSKAKRAIYIDPDILLDNINKLLEEASMQPYNSDVEGRTAMLIGKGSPVDYFAQDYDYDNPQRQTLAPIETVVQNAAYRMVRIAVAGMLFDSGFSDLMDSRWMVHALQSDDSRLFRCDVFGEVVQWGGNTDRSALEFILGLHDMWSRVIAKESDDEPWWIGEDVVTVPEGHNASTRRRRLQEVPKEDENSAKEEDDEDEKEDTANDGEDRKGMQAEAVEQEEVNHEDVKRGESSEESDHNFDEDSDNEKVLTERDYSSYDTWMGVLSATSVKYFVRIVPSSEVGVVSLTD
mmetsp:Transcript_17583/g.43253  ORF Transcript_17583/g.43253 Transcript_17583/m.43253 type:complete len:869 (+) Transcript_17583:107-2713(+)